jgi:ribosomal-protein-alanine N-acetyltransferase
MLETQRLQLIPATASLLEAEIANRSTFEHLLGAAIPDNWPPATLADALPSFLQSLKKAPVETAGWFAWYGVRKRSGQEPAVLICSAGFKEPPRKGIVETGYAVLPQFQGQGYATEMVGALVRWALDNPLVRRVIAETTLENRASVRVLTKLGFRGTGKGTEPGTVHFELRRQQRPRAQLSS